MTVRYLSVCSGIEAASAAWHPLGWSPVAFAEIEAFPSAVLANHYPEVSNLGDITRFQSWPGADVDLLVGGTPCQSFSVAGLRKGLADPRGNLALVYLAIADRYRPRWVLWENVPGVLSDDGGRSFGSIIGGLAELGYGWAYRVLDAQHVRVDGFGRAVPQRRRRVFVVGYLGDWRRAAAVLFERASLSGDTPPRREAGQGAAGTIAGGARGYAGRRKEDDSNLAVIALKKVHGSSDAGADRNSIHGEPDEPMFTLNANDLHGIMQGWAVRRLTPRECERLQGFPDDYTAITFRGKPAADGPRYKALGNSMAVNVIRWIGQRIAMVEAAAPALSEAAE